MNPIHQVMYSRADKLSATFFIVDQAPLLRVPTRVVEIFRPFHETALPTLYEIQDKFAPHYPVSFLKDALGMALFTAHIAEKPPLPVQSVIGEAISIDLHLVTMIDGALTLFESGLREMKLRAVTSRRAEKAWLGVAEFLFMKGMN